MLEEKFEFYSPYNVNIHDLDPDLQNSLSVMQNLDFMTHRHCQKVGNLTARLCTYMHFNSKFILHCLVAGYVHDVGKLFIDPKILHKDGKLTPEEFEIMKTHTTKGYEYCMKDHNLMYYSDGPWYHHEALNGTGYPRGLTKKDIPLSGQIIRVADEYDALVTKRHYKTHVNISETLKDMIVDTEPPKNVVALDFLKQNQHLGKINKKPLKALFKVVIDDILYEIAGICNYINYLKDQLKRLRTVESYDKKIQSTHSERTKEYYGAGMKMLLKPGETFENYKQLITEFSDAIVAREDRIKQLYDEIKIIKKLKV